MRWRWSGKGSMKRWSVCVCSGLPIASKSDSSRSHAYFVHWYSLLPAKQLCVQRVVRLVAQLTAQPSPQISVEKSDPHKEHDPFEDCTSWQCQCLFFAGLRMGNYIRTHKKNNTRTLRIVARSSRHRSKWSMQYCIGDVVSAVPFSFSSPFHALTVWATCREYRSRQVSSENNKCDNDSHIQIEDWHEYSDIHYFFHDFHMIRSLHSMICCAVDTVLAGSSGALAAASSSREVEGFGRDQELFRLSSAETTIEA